MAFSPDGTKIALAAADGHVFLADVQSGELVLKLQGHEGPAHAVVFTADGKNLITTGAD